MTKVINNSQLNPNRSEIWQGPFEFVILNLIIKKTETVLFSFNANAGIFVDFLFTI